ncbi:MAG: elongation factor P hydroxylase [Pseudomonadales bacterium]
MEVCLSDDEYCAALIEVFAEVFPALTICGDADEPFYRAPQAGEKAVLYFRSNYPRSLLHEMSHYCLAGDRRRQLDDFDYWYTPCGRSADEQLAFERVEARPQGLEKRFCELAGLTFSPSLDDFSGRPASEVFLQGLDSAYREMCERPPKTAAKAIAGLKKMALAC